MHPWRPAGGPALLPQPPPPPPSVKRVLSRAPHSAQVAAKLQETERKLRDQEVVLKAVTLERDRAVQALSTRGPLSETDAQVGAPAPRPPCFPRLLWIVAMGNGAWQSGH